MTRPHYVVVPHIETSPLRDVRSGLGSWEQYANYELTSVSDPFAYASLFRRLWRRQRTVVINEGDVQAKPYMISELLNCAEPWCTYRMLVDGRLLDDTFGLVCFRSELMRSHPALGDVMAAPIDPRYWVRTGHTSIPRTCDVATLNTAGRRATLLPDSPHHLSAQDPYLRPTTHDWFGIDTTTGQLLRALGYAPHVHDGMPLHLHDYVAVPVSSRLPWHQRPYVAREWLHCR